MIHDQQITSLSKVNKSDVEQMTRIFNSNMFVVEKSLNNRLSNIPWTFHQHGLSTFITSGATKTRLLNGTSELRLYFIKEYDWTELTIDAHVSGYINGGSSNTGFTVWAVLNNIQPSDPSSDLTNTSGHFMGNWFANQTSQHQSDMFTSGPISTVDVETSPTGTRPLTAGKYALSIYIERTTGTANFNMDLYDDFWLRVVEHPPTPRIF